MIESSLRRRVAWLIGIRAVISTMLLGSATVARITSRGSFAVDPLFFLIGLTYALTIVYALTLRFVDTRRWLVDLQLAVDALIVSAFIYFTGGITSVFSSLYVLPIVAASTLQFRRGGLMVATLSAVLYVGLVLEQYLNASGILTSPWLVGRAIVLPPRSVAQYTVALNVFGFFAVALLSGSLADSLRSAGARLEQASTEIAGPAGAQPARHRQPAERPGDDRSRAAHPDVQPRGDDDHRRDVRGGRRPSDWRGAAAARRAGGRPERRDATRSRGASRSVTARPTDGASSRSA